MDEAMEDVLKTTLSNNVTMTRIRMKRRELCILVVERRGVLSWYDPSTVIKSFFEDRRRSKVGKGRPRMINLSCHFFRH